MDNPDPRHDAVKSVFSILRRATRLVQLAPFAYLCFYAAYLLTESFIGEQYVLAADYILAASPLATVGMLVASRLFKLCTWHKVACLLPTSSQVEGFIDNFVFQFTQQEVSLINALLAAAALFFFASAIRHFAHGH